MSRSTFAFLIRNCASSLRPGPPPAEKQRFIRGQIIINADAPSAEEEEEAEQKRQEEEEEERTTRLRHPAGNSNRLSEMQRRNGQDDI